MNAADLRGEIRSLLKLAVPVVVVQVGLMFMGVVDTLMVGRVSAVDLAAVAMGNLYFYGISIFGVGLLMSLDPIVAQAIGASDDDAVARGIQRGLVLALALSIITSVLLLFAEPVLLLFRQPADVVPRAATYARVVAPAMLPFYVFVVLRQTLQATHRMSPIVWAIVLANLINAVLNWIFIFGHFGFPAAGVVGAAWATMIGRWFMPLLLVAFAWRDLRPRLVPWRHDVMRRDALQRILGLGAPIGAQMMLEYGVFAVAGLLMGWMGTVPMAGHQVALNLASLTFMVPLGVSAAAAVLVGNAVGRGDMPGARRAALASLVCGVSFMTASALLMLAVPEFFASIYTSQAPVVAVAITLIPIAGIFQVFDGVQVVSIGILRGLADTRAPMLINVLGFWLLGLPVSWYLGIEQGLGPTGLWWGLTLGLVVVAIILALRVRSRIRGNVERLIIDQSVMRDV